MVAGDGVRSALWMGAVMSNDAVLGQAMPKSSGEHHPLRAAGQPGWVAKAGPLVAMGVLLIGAIYAVSGLVSDLETAPSPGVLIYGLLALALLIALGFEFVNGFHDTANAVATVIYTHSMPAHAAVI